jgi:sugar phosphate isomerase/epimerase
MQSRRGFLKTTTLATSSMVFGIHKFASANNRSKFKIGGFTKELQSLSYEETAQAVFNMGWDGIECPVRPGGHVLPERVEEDLPRMVEALQKRKLELQIMATSIHNPSEKYTERVLRTARQLGIRYYRMGWWNYDFSKPIQRQLDDIKVQMKELAELNGELDIIGVYQNHSGDDSVGAPVWDIYELLSDVRSDYIGCHFDIGHATVEGGYAWRIHYERIKPFIKAVIVKDFKWLYTESRQGEAEWCPIGQGMIHPEFFKLLKTSAFNGPVTMHFEYDVPGTGNERLKNLMNAMKKDGEVLRKWLS